MLTLDVTEAWHGQRPVLGPLRLSLAPGEVVALCGPSGVGKSTLLRIVADLHRGWRGTRQVLGPMAMVFQEPTLLPWRNLVQNITLVAGCSAAQARVALAEVGLDGRAVDLPGALSLGQQRRLALARAVAARPDLLLLDEPFVSLDPTLAEDMMTLFQRLQSRFGFAALLVTHSEAEATRLANRVLRLEGAPARLAA